MLVRPANSISSTSLGRSMPVSDHLLGDRHVDHVHDELARPPDVGDGVFDAAVGPVWMPRMRIGGSCEKTLKKLIGAALLQPCSSMVVTSAIGLGPTKLVSSR